MNRDDELSSVVVNILDKEYKVACPSLAEGDLHSAAKYLDKQLRKVRISGRIIGADRIAIMAGLNIAYELLTLQKKAPNAVEGLTERLHGLQNKIDEALSENKGRHVKIET
jgi:cell division protein ZapA